MENKTTEQLPNGIAINYKKIGWIVSIALITPVILYYLWTRGIVYFKFSKDVYTEYFWYRAPWLLVHVICGVTATLIGPLQFIPAIRAKNPLLHRNLGKTYIGCIVLSTFVSFYLASTAQLGIVYVTGLATLGIVWLSTTLMAWLSIIRGNKEMHREWMIKSYVLTLSFIVFRFVEDLLARAEVSDFVGRKVLMAWGCWAIPFFMTVLVLELRKLYRKAPHFS
jgi:uncharacterized membrane protein